MYFDSYEGCLRAAIKQSKGQLGDIKLYIKHSPNGPFDGICPGGYKIGFTPDNLDDAYIYNGEVMQVEKKAELSILNKEYYEYLQAGG